MLLVYTTEMPTFHPDCTWCVTPSDVRTHASLHFYLMAARCIAVSTVTKILLPTPISTGTWTSMKVGHLPVHSLFKFNVFNTTNCMCGESQTNDNICNTQGVPLQEVRVHNSLFYFWNLILLYKMPLN